jgi:hypothetical protein
MFFKKRGQDVRKCPQGHILDPEWDKCPYCASQQSDEFLDESRATHRSAPPAAVPPPAPMPPVAPPPAAATPPRPAAPPPAAPPRPTSPPPAAADPDITQISRPGQRSGPPPPASPPLPTA